MPDPFASPKRRLARAKQHIDAIKRGAEAFFADKPTAHVIERDPVTGFDIHKLRLVKSLPDEITDLIYEALQALRDTLDHTVYPVAIACHATRPDLIHFPIGNDVADFENLMRGRVKDFPPDILTLLRGFKPYKGGNGDPIWALNKIRRQGTHRLIVPMGFATPGIAVQHMEISGNVAIPGPRWDSINNEIVIARAGPGSRLHYNLNVGFFIAFGEVEGVAGQSAIPVLDAMAAEVGRIVLAIETESRRIGLIP